MLFARRPRFTSSLRFWAACHNLLLESLLHHSLHHQIELCLVEPRHDRRLHPSTTLSRVDVPGPPCCPQISPPNMVGTRPTKMTSQLFLPSRETFVVPQPPLPSEVIRLPTTPSRLDLRVKIGSWPSNELLAAPLMSRRARELPGSH